MTFLVDRRRANALLVFVGLLLGCTPLAGCNGRSTADKPSAPQWKTTVVDDRFSFEMPGDPTRSVETPDTPVGKVEVKFFQLTNDQGTGAYAFNATELPAVLAEPKGDEIEQRLDGAQQGAVNSAKGKLLKSEKIEFAGYSGRDCLIQLPSTAIARMHIFLVRRTIVVMQAINIVSEDADRFFKSLKLLKDTASPEPVKPQAKP